MDVDSFLTEFEDEIDAMLGTESMTVGGQTFNVVWNDDTKATEGALGGLEGDIQAVATAQASDVTNPRSLLNKRATIDGQNYRVSQVRTGTVAVHFILTDINASE